MSVGLLLDLQSGAVGVRCSLAQTGEVVRDKDTEACVQDATHAVLWTCDRNAWRTDLGPETLQLLRFDLQRHAKGLFDALFEPGESASKPKTADGEWSPLVEAQTQILGGRVLRLIHRTRFAPDAEVVEGRLVIPTLAGTVSISAVASADESGLREKTVMAKVRAAKGSVHPPGRSLQTITDEAEWDDEFPEHPLTRVRAALDWLASPKGGGLEVVSPESATWIEAVTLDEAASTISARPRFLRVPKGALSLPEGMGVLSRVVFAADERPRTVEVWRVPGVEVTKDFGVELERIAGERTSGWAEQDAATDIEVKTMSANATSQRAELIQYVRYRVASQLLHTMRCWFTDTDGAVFMIGASGPRYAPANDLWEDMAQTTRSWKRIADVPAPAPSARTAQKSEWWRFWRKES